MERSKARWAEAMNSRASRQTATLRRAVHVLLPPALQEVHGSIPQFTTLFPRTTITSFVLRNKQTHLVKRFFVCLSGLLSINKNLR